MKSAASHPLLALTTLHLALLCSVAAFSPSRLKCPRSSTTKPWHRRTISSSTTLTFGAADECNDERDSDEIYRGDSNRSVPNDIGLDIIRGSNSEISDETWGDIEGGAPSGWMVMKGLLGINIFTYVLAVLIIFFLGANAVLGPGWLGQSLGWEDVGTFTKVSDSLPLNVDVSGPDYLL
ncbi:hypothetical protein ACHAXA_006094 [Cyclostephanos tholiformis]|uniref:Uncharacterized protein n=1 Tax=Cyclostephanos tholiformis TaxID=382380 RepID=A0ABD3SAX3_9STRA